MKKLASIFLCLGLALTLISAGGKNMFHREFVEIKNANALSAPGAAPSVTYDNIESVIKSFDGPAMNSAVGSADESLMIKVNARNGTLVKGYLKEKCGIITDEDGVESPEATLIFGLFQYGKEKQLGDISQADIDNVQNRVAGDPFNCLVGTIGSIIGIGEVRELYNDYQHGVSPKTILKTLKTLVRRIGSVFTVITSVYYFGDCLNWW